MFLLKIKSVIRKRILYINISITIIDIVECTLWLMVKPKVFCFVPVTIPYRNSHVAVADDLAVCQWQCTGLGTLCLKSLLMCLNLHLIGLAKCKVKLSRKLMYSLIDFEFFGGKVYRVSDSHISLKP